MSASAHSPEEAAWMAAALDQARRAQAAGEVPVGAVVVLDGKVIGSGHNTTEDSDDPSAHAEINALRAAGAAFGDWRLEQSTLVVTLEPCAMCMGAIALARVERVVYGASDPRLGACGSALDVLDAAVAPHLRSVEGGLMADECSAILKDFFKALR
jgi:tRNA(adenine34) deaminase